MRHGTAAPAWTWLRVGSHAAAAWELAARLEAQGAASVTLVPAPASRARLEPAPGETPLWPELEVRALFAARAEAQTAAARLRAGGHAPRVEACPGRDWLAVGRAGFAPRHFGGRLWVVPEWCVPPEPHAANVLLAPGLAFGTGMHPTTALCLEWLAAADLAGASVIDYGTGSGILALAAARLGAARVAAVDVDPQALAAARANAERNRVALEAVAPADLVLRDADVLLANILARPLVALAPELLGRVRPGGRLVLAGVTTAQGDAVAAAYLRGARLARRAVRAQWERLELVRTERTEA